MLHKKGTIYQIEPIEYNVACGKPGCEFKGRLWLSAAQDPEKAFEAKGWQKTRKHGWTCHHCARKKYHPWRKSPEQIAFEEAQKIESACLKWNSIQ